MLNFHTTCTKFPISWDLLQHHESYHCTKFELPWIDRCCYNFHWLQCHKEATCSNSPASNYLASNYLVSIYLARLNSNYHGQIIWARIIWLRIIWTQRTRCLLPISVARRDKLRNQSLQRRKAKLKKLRGIATKQRSIKRSLIRLARPPGRYLPKIIATR